MSAGKKKGVQKGAPIWVIVLLIGVPILAVLVGAPLAIYGVRKYMTNAKRAEATSVLVGWGEGLVRCGAADKLPPSSTPIPASMSAIAAKKYQSSPSEWSEPAHTCAGFSMRDPQYFQYTWELTSPSVGTLHARADLDGDGNVDASLDMVLVCNEGKCLHRAPTDEDGKALLVGKEDAAGPGSSGTSSSGTSRALGGSSGMSDTVVGLYTIWCGLCVLVLFATIIARIVIAFDESVGWGFAVLCVPFAGLVYLVKYWHRAKRPFFWALGAWGGLMAGTLVVGGLAIAAGPDGKVSGPAPVAVAPARAPTFVPPPPPPPPVVTLEGAASDLSTVMGRARKLANAWQPDAALLGVEANLVGAKIQTQDGAKAKVTFGPSPFGAADARAGLFVVTYDKSGITAAPAKGRPGKALPEPMCAPEGVFPRLDDNLKNSPITLRYGLDGSQRPSWLVSLPGDPKPLRAYSPDDCTPRGTFAARPRR